MYSYIYSRRSRRRRCVRTWGGLRVKTSFVAGAGKVSLLKISLTRRKFIPSAVSSSNFPLQIDGRQRKLSNSKHWCLVDSPYVIVSRLVLTRTVPSLRNAPANSIIRSKNYYAIRSDLGNVSYTPHVLNNIFDNFWDALYNISTGGSPIAISFSGSLEAYIF